MKAIKIPNENKYYKFVENTWQQPTLTSNGVMGSDAMAVNRVNSGHSYNFGTAYESFSSNTGQNGFYCNEYKGWMYFNIYFPQPIKLTNISFFIPYTNDSADGGAYNCCLWGGNWENDRREEIKNIGTVGENSGYNSALTSNNFYNYYTLYLENGGWGHEDKVTIKNILFAGVEKKLIEATEEDYDVIGSTYNCKVFNINGKLYAQKGE